MFYIPYTSLEDIEQSKKAMEDFKEDFKETFGVEYREKPSDDGEYYYCGLCKCRMHISHFSH